MTKVELVNAVAERTGLSKKDAGGAVDFLASYQRQSPVLDAAQRQRAQVAAGDGSIWLFSSSEAVHNLPASLPDVDWGRARAVATHARIAQACRTGEIAMPFSRRLRNEDGLRLLLRPSKQISTISVSAFGVHSTAY